MPFWNYAYVFLISMVPIIELRGAIPVGIGLGIEPWLCCVIAFFGNLLPVPFILLFIRKLLEWMKKTKKLSKIALWIEAKAKKNSVKVLKFSALGLFLFVAIPLPGTGAWTGALVAAFLDMRMKYSIPSIAAGLVVASLIIVLISTGVFSALNFLL